jgi:hypothetical protein
MKRPMTPHDREATAGTDPALLDRATMLRRAALGATGLLMGGTLARSV